MLLPLLAAVLLGETVFSLECYHSTQIVKDLKDLIYDENVYRKDSSTLNKGSFVDTPRCLIIRGHNSTHSLSVQAVASSLDLPIECKLEASHCYRTTEGVPFLSAACCCSTPLCNLDDDVITLYDPTAIQSSFLSGVLQSGHSFLCFLVHVTIPALLVVLGTAIEVACKKKLKVEFFSEKSDRDIWSSERTQNCASSRKDPPMNVEVTQKSSYEQIGLKQSRTKVKSKSTAKTARGGPFQAPSTADSYAHIDAVTPRQLSVKEAPVAGSTVVRSCPTQSDRPAPIRLPNGRIQHVSMNHDESTYSDLKST